jgi:hypothetical protein
MANRYLNGLNRRHLYMATASTPPTASTPQIALVQQPMGMMNTAIMNPNYPIYHIRHSPYDGCPVENVHLPTTIFLATRDLRFPTWIYIECSNGAGGTMGGWVGIQHVILLPQSMQNAYITLNTYAIVSTGFTNTVGRFVPVGSMLVIIGMTTDRRWCRLDTGAWIPRSWLQ